MALDYEYTCPLIDNNILQIKAYIKSYLLDYLEQDYTCPSRGEFEYEMQTLADELYEGIMPYIESVRQTNQDLRLAVDKQITQLEDEVAIYKENFERALICI